VEVDNRRVLAEPFVYILLHKPRGVMCTLSDPEGRETIAPFLRHVGVRVVPVGRLDFHTSGALLCSNDGQFASRLLHPRDGVAKEYVAKVRGVLDDKGLDGWRESIDIDGRATRPAHVSVLRVEGDKTWLSIVLREGRNRQVRRLGEATGFPVMRLARTAHAGINTEGLRPGEWRHLSVEELTELKRLYGVPRNVRAAARPVEGSAPTRPSRSRARTRHPVRLEVAAQAAAPRSPGAPAGRDTARRSVKTSFDEDAPRLSSTRPQRGAARRAEGTKAQRGTRPAFSAAPRDSAGPGRSSGPSAKHERGGARPVGSKAARGAPRAAASAIKGDRRSSFKAPGPKQQRGAPPRAASSASSPERGASRARSQKGQRPRRAH
jgi:23S rRNA pseudouridine2605 synthase